MWFKNLFVYRMTASWKLTASEVEDAVSRHEQRPILLTETLSAGWEPIYDGLFANVVNRQIMLQFKTEKKSVPASAVKAELQKRIDEIEARQGRKPGKKERRELKDEVIFTLLPKVLPTVSRTRLWIDPINGWIVVDTASQATADRVMSALVQALEKIEMQTLYVARNPASEMAAWLTDPDGPSDSAFSIDRACELKATDESGAVVRYNNHNLDSDDLREHIRTGKVCKKLALTWNDRISFVLTDTFRIKGVKALDLVYEGQTTDAEDQRELDDDDFVLMTGELNQMLNQLVAAFGGEPPREAKEENLFG